MNNFIKGMILTMMIIYIVYPVDVCPGPIDDVLIFVIGLAAQKKIGFSEE